MHIVIFHQYYLLPNAAGGSRFNAFARLWAEAGHRVTVIAGNLDYSTGEVPECYRGHPYVREQDGPVTVWRCHVPRTYRANYLGRSLAYAGYAVAATCAAMHVQNPDIIIATSPPLPVIAPAYALARRFPSAKLIFEVRDLWPESAVTTGVLSPTAPWTRGLYALERWAYRVADGINVLTPAFHDDIVARQLAPASKLLFVPNGADLESFPGGPPDPAVRATMGWGSRSVVLYAGAHGRANALDQLIDTAVLLRSRPDILIACVGDGPERAQLVVRAARLELDNIVFYGARPKGAMPDLWRAADAGIAVLQRNPTFRTVYPNKVFDCMAAARPVILGIDGIARRLVCDQARAGVFAEPEHPADIAAQIITLVDDPRRRRTLGARGRRWVEAHASRRALAQNYLQAMHALCGLPAERVDDRRPVASSRQVPGKARSHAPRGAERDVPSPGAPPAP